MRTFHALGYSWLASRNLAEGFERLVRYSSVVNTASKGALHIEESEQSFDFFVNGDRVFPPPVPAAIDAGMSTIVNMCRVAYGHRFRPMSVSMTHPDPGCAEQFNELFKAPVLFDQESEDLATANPELVRVNDNIVTDYLAGLDRDDVVMRVRSELIARLPSGQIDEADIASSINMSRRSLQRKLRQQGINMSRRSLQRKLRQQGVSFTELLDRSRRELGLQYVRDPQYSLNEIAYLLGFAEPGNFTRAFKRWYGKPPSRFRMQD
jgi:AraC-like DNA-binding protein